MHSAFLARSYRLREVDVQSIEPVFGKPWRGHQGRPGRLVKIVFPNHDANPPLGRGDCSRMQRISAGHGPVPVTIKRWNPHSVLGHRVIESARTKHPHAVNRISSHEVRSLTPGLFRRNPVSDDCERKQQYCQLATGLRFEPFWPVAGP